MRLSILLSKRTVFFTLSILLAFASNSWAQTNGSLGFLSIEERQRLDKENKEKDRTETLLKMSTSHLEAARSSFHAENFEQASNEVQNYGNLMDYTVDFINTSVKKEGDKKKLFKMVDLSLRRDLLVLEALRYDLPGKYAEQATEVCERMRKIRIKALSALFGKDFFPNAD